MKRLKGLTLKQKAQLCSGRDNWRTVEVDGVLSEVFMADGPHGLRKEVGKNDKASDVAPNGTVRATCFPPAALTGCSFNRELFALLGYAIAEEAIAENVDIVLGPGVNIKRTPLCGRNFEYVSEDPYLAGEYAVSYINAMQGKGIGSSLKHFACNNQESYRMNIDVRVDERAFREIYLYAFEQAVKRAAPYTVMASYNRLEGSFATQNKRLLTDILREEWGYDGCVISDWSAVSDRVEALQAGCDLEMPYSGKTRTDELVSAVNNGVLDERVLDESVMRIVRLVDRCRAVGKGKAYDKAEHHRIAYEIAADSMVLLKNDGILPLDSSDGKRIVVIGELAKIPRYQGGGSSHIEPTRLSSPLDELKRYGFNVDYEAGYDSVTGKHSDKLIERAVKLAASSKTVLLFVGLTDFDEYEGLDRADTKLSYSQLKLISELSKVNRNIIAVLCCGSAVETEWVKDVRACLYASVSGQAGAEAVVNLLVGKRNPSGKLTETFPIDGNTPFNGSCLGGNNAVYYTEGIYVGYRYYQATNTPVAFPFGYGLSYTNFTICAELCETQNGAEVVATVTNTGLREGAEVVQVYVGSKNAPFKQLKGFEKVYLNAGQSQTVTIPLGFDSFKRYDTVNGWIVDGGEYTVYVGNSSESFVYQATVCFTGESGNDGYPVETDIDGFKRRYARKLPPLSVTVDELNADSVGEDIARAKSGKAFMSVCKGFLRLSHGGKDMTASRRAMLEQTRFMPLRSMTGFSGGVLNYGCTQPLLDIFNGRTKLISGMKSVLRIRKRDK